MTDDLCTCGHARNTHEHSRPGTFCGSCPCNRYRQWFHGRTMGALAVWWFYLRRMRKAA